MRGRAALPRRLVFRRRRRTSGGNGTRPYQNQRARIDSALSSKRVFSVERGSVRTGLKARQMIAQGKGSAALGNESKSTTSPAGVPETGETLLRPDSHGCPSRPLEKFADFLPLSPVLFRPSRAFHPFGSVPR